MKRWLAASLLVLVLLLAGAYVSIRHMPFYLPELDDAAPALPDTAPMVFAYGSLTNPIVRLVVIGRHVSTRPAWLEGFRPVGRDLERDPDGAVPGELFEVTVEEMRRLDRYERLGTDYARVEALIEDDLMAWVYFRIRDD